MSDVKRAKRRLSAMKALLSEERALIRAGAIGAIAALSARRAAAMAGLESLSPAALAPHGGLIAEIRAAAARNHRLLLAYLDGARAARDRLLSGRLAAGLTADGRPAFAAYRRDGSRVETAGGPSTRDSRA